MPDDVLEQAERVAKRLGVSRSELYTRAMREFFGLRRDRAITASYDEAFARSDDDETERFRREALRRALASVEWSED